MSNLVGNPLDPRCIQTRERIISACMDLLETMHGDALSVSLLTHAADIHRSTFYLHFRDMDNVAESLLIDLCIHPGELALLGKLASNDSRDSLQSGIDSILSRILNELRKRSTSYLNLTRMKGFPGILDSLTRRIAREFAGLHPSRSDPDTDLILACACTGILFHSLRAGLSPERNLKTRLASIILDILASF